MWRILLKVTGFSITQSERFSGAGKTGGQHWQVRQAHVLITQELTGYSEAWTLTIYRSAPTDTPQDRVAENLNKRSC